MKGVHYVLGHPFSMSMDWTLGEGAAKRRMRGIRNVKC